MRFWVLRECTGDFEDDGIRIKGRVVKMVVTILSDVTQKER